MRLASYRNAGRDSYGIVRNDGILDLGVRMPGMPDLLDAIAAGALTDDLFRDEPSDVSLAAVTWRLPVTRPEKIWCIGVNYADRNAEYKDGTSAPKYPSLFCRTPSSFAAHGEPLERPRVSTQLDYEGEIVLVIGEAGRHITREAAMDHVFGYTLCNEGSVRDWLHHGKFNVTQGKNFDRSGSIGPWIVKRSGAGDDRPFELTTRVNGEVRQHETTDRLMFPFDYLISYLSTFATLKPGDLIVTGTPTGAGARFDPPRWLKPGDVVEVEVPRIGCLSNTVVDEA